MKIFNEMFTKSYKTILSTAVNLMRLADVYMNYYSHDLVCFLMVGTIPIMT